MAHLVLVRPGFVPAPAPILPRCTAPRADTVCLDASCTSLLGYLLGSWRHVDFCLDCLSSPTRNPDCEHVGCADPEPVRCTHEVEWRCDEPASLTARCAYARADQTCCGCCWVDTEPTGPRRLHRP